MSSTGKLSPVMGYASTLAGEQKRQSGLGSVGALESLHKIDGIISQVRQSPLSIKAYNRNDGSMIAQDKWIRLVHSAEEIREKFGTVTIGWGVHVEYRFPDGSDAMATITHAPDAKPGQEEELLNDVETGLWEIFTP